MYTPIYNQNKNTVSKRIGYLEEQRTDRLQGHNFHKFPPLHFILYMGTIRLRYLNMILIPCCHQLFYTTYLCSIPAHTSRGLDWWVLLGNLSTHPTPNTGTKTPPKMRHHNPPLAEPTRHLDYARLIKQPGEKTNERPTATRPHGASPRDRLPDEARRSPMDRIPEERAGLRNGLLAATLHGRLGNNKKIHTRRLPTI